MPRVLKLNRYDRKIQYFRRWFQAKRKFEKVTQRDLAKKLNCSQQNISAKLKDEANAEITYTDLLVFFEQTHATDEEILTAMKMTKGV